MKVEGGGGIEEPLSLAREPVRKGMRVVERQRKGGKAEGASEEGKGIIKE